MAMSDGARRCSAPAMPASSPATDGFVRRDDENRSESYADILGARRPGGNRGTRQRRPGPGRRGAHAMHAHGAVFAEVKVDPDLGQVRVTRLVGAFAAGRIINPRLVRSQYYGGMIWGVSFALHERPSSTENRPRHECRSRRVPRAGKRRRSVPRGAADPEDDPYVNVLGIKGVGEIGITGTVGAVANAVWHATGVRVRKFPVRIEDFMASISGAQCPGSEGKSQPVSGRLADLQSISEPVSRSSRTCL